MHYTHYYIRYINIFYQLIRPFYQVYSINFNEYTFLQLFQECHSHSNFEHLNVRAKKHSQISIGYHKKQVLTDKNVKKTRLVSVPGQVIAGIYSTFHIQPTVFIIYFIYIPKAISTVCIPREGYAPRYNNIPV